MAEARRLPVRIGSFADFMDPDADFEVHPVRAEAGSRREGSFRPVVRRSPGSAQRTVSFHHDPDEDFAPLDLVADEQEYDTW